MRAVVFVCWHDARVDIQAVLLLMVKFCHVPVGVTSLYVFHQVLGEKDFLVALGQVLDKIMAYYLEVCKKNHNLVLGTLKVVEW